MKKLFYFALIAASLAASGSLPLQAQEQPIEIGGTASFSGTRKPILIHLSGFTGEVAEVLKFDLYVMGFKEETSENALYELSGSNNGDVKAELRFTRGGGGAGAAGRPASLLAQIYTGPNARALAHRLADDVVLKVTGINGIAETHIAYKSGSGRTSEIYIADFDGHNAQEVTHDHSDVAAPCWVPGRMALYYTSYKLGGPSIFYHNLSTGERRNFAHYGGMNSAAAVSRDGRRVAMILSKTGSPDVFVCDADGSNLKDLTPTREDESSPCWSPDGQWICFAGKVKERRALCKVSANGGPIRPLETAMGSPSEPDWSPDGKWIVFTSQHGGNFDICVVPAAGGAAVALVSGEDPSWAPNSRNVIFVKRSNGNRVLSLLDVPTKQVKDVTRLSGRESSNSQPSWAR